MTMTRSKALTGLATATLVVAQAVAAPSFGAIPRLTKTTAAKYARADGLAAAAITPGDKVSVTGCHALGRTGAFNCQVELIPVASKSRCRWTSTVRLVKGRPSITYAHANCTG